MALRLFSWAMKVRRLWSWYLELPVWISCMSWVISGDCCRLLRARAVRGSVGWLSVF